ncbi:hypothetical protein DM02DRAFT_672551 [Periconia macrospinosa]|uniref:Uncharacterized protein n=1 Tax=Periconia macrospinosa TaxID=97972 RepID=A0A2V1DNR7_9PLEO|nr:hypothetical protein DM02DRAFT_672551 [Periconia macrospinosa]
MKTPTLDHEASIHPLPVRPPFATPPVSVNCFKLRLRSAPPAAIAPSRAALCTGTWLRHEDLRLCPSARFRRGGIVDRLCAALSRSKTSVPRLVGFFFFCTASRTRWWRTGLALHGLVGPESQLMDSHQPPRLAACPSDSCSGQSTHRQPSDALHDMPTQRPSDPAIRIHLITGTAIPLLGIPRAKPRPRKVQSEPHAKALLSSNLKHRRACWSPRPRRIYFLLASEVPWTEDHW